MAIVCRDMKLILFYMLRLLNSPLQELTDGVLRPTLTFVIYMLLLFAGGLNLARGQSPKTEREATQAELESVPTLNLKADGFRGIWYMNQPSNDEYVYKYSGGLGTYCAKHKPFAIYAARVNKTFFCFGRQEEA